jgi:DNA (cytosine-5)-methyltransferase 3A
VLENVASMPKADKDIITKEMGVEPVMFNASLVSAQCRKRLFWTNIPFDLPVDRGILLKDILQPDGEVDERMVVKGKSYTLTATYSHANTTEAGIKNSVERKQRTLVKFTETAQTGLYKIRGRDVILGESPLQVLQEGRTELGKKLRKEIKEQTGKDSTSRSGGHKAYFGKEGTKATCLTTALGAEGLIVEFDRIRKLTPIECERLQGLPDNYTEGVATTNRYKCLGNAFNVDVVAHILSGVKICVVYNEA